MGGHEHDEDPYAFEIGDIVRESILIIPPSRSVWTGIVVYIVKDYYELYSSLGPTEALVAVHWFRAGYIESLPASVLEMVQKAHLKKTKKA
jgi:hypothetical protein